MDYVSNDFEKRGLLTENEDLPSTEEYQENTGKHEGLTNR
ncbi:uncharacterized protein TOL2_C41660 [Desulfobacula toluolica Tol2]|uniref:Uncharacterized protein n=1 Tax=Desulfobacula toluolica (strain DSM 7467 / Tol2) TaxID=651182 RepID=K0NTD7_DESTT|nr:uncharacterized protein TOL2_C41660 [Desulfobacula toluolica Tol2]